MSEKKLLPFFVSNENFVNGVYFMARFLSWILVLFILPLLTSLWYRDVQNSTSLKSQILIGADNICMSWIVCTRRPANCFGKRRAFEAGYSPDEQAKKQVGWGTTRPSLLLAAFLAQATRGGLGGKNNAPLPRMSSSPAQTSSNSNYHILLTEI